MSEHPFELGKRVYVKTHPNGMQEIIRPLPLMPKVVWDRVLEGWTEGGYTLQEIYERPPVRLKGVPSKNRSFSVVLPKEAHAHAWLCKPKKKNENNS
jgi:hypothetical protein